MSRRCHCRNGLGVSKTFRPRTGCFAIHGDISRSASCVHGSVALANGMEGCTVSCLNVSSGLNVKLATVVGGRGGGGDGLNAKSIDNRTRTSDEENVIVQTRQTALSVVSNASGERWWLQVLENMVHCSAVVLVLLDECELCGLPGLYTSGKE